MSELMKRLYGNLKIHVRCCVCGHTIRIQRPSPEQGLATAQMLGPEDGAPGLAVIGNGNDINLSEVKFVHKGECDEILTKRDGSWMEVPHFFHVLLGDDEVQNLADDLEIHDQIMC